LDIFIRNIEPSTVKKIDELAKINNQSRNEYLKNHLNSFAINNIQSNVMERYEKQLETNMILLEKTNEVLDNVDNTFKELMEYE